VLQGIRVNYPSRVGSSARMDPQLGMICGSDEILDSDGSSARNAPLARDGISRTRVLQGIQVNYPSRVGSSARMDPQLGMICGSDEILDSDGSSAWNAPLARDGISRTQVLQGIRVNYPSQVVGSVEPVGPK
jgi:hypothetical protein